jgi:hypothetical protein
MKGSLGVSSWRSFCSTNVVNFWKRASTILVPEVIWTVIMRHIFWAKRLDELEPFEYGNIEVQPFHVERFGTLFGLIARPPDEDVGGGWWVELRPGNYMAFQEPWDSGEYDT